MDLKTIIAGSRSITEYSVVVDAIESAPFSISEVVSGGADGVDSLGEKWAGNHGIPVDVHPYSDYFSEADERGMPAPLVRNEAMSKEGEALIAIWDGESRGTKHMIDCAESEGLEIHLVRTDSSRLDEFF